MDEITVSDKYVGRLVKSQPLFVVHQAISDYYVSTRIDSTTYKASGSTWQEGILNLAKLMKADGVEL